MKKSGTVPVALVSTMAAAILSGCGGPRYDREVRRCVDTSGRILPDYQCERPYSSGIGYYGYPRWVYGGSPLGGGRLSGFRSSPMAGNEVVSSSGRVITRGGLGVSGRSGGSFGGFSS